MNISGKNHFILVFFLMMAVAISGCGGSQQPKPAEKPKSISITYVKAPLNVPSIVEKKAGLFEKEFGKDSIAVTFPEITVGPKQTEALAAGSLDFAHGLGGTSAILAAANGVDLKVIGIYSRAPKAFVMMVKNPQIQTIADLKGKKIAGPKGTVLHQLALAALAKNQLKPEDVQFISMDIPGAVAALMNGSVDAAMAAGPDVTRTEQGGARVLTTGEGFIEATIVTAVSGEFLRKHPDLVKRFIKVHQESLAFIKANNSQSVEMTATETGLSPDRVQSMLALYDFDFKVKPSDIEELKRTQDFLVQNGMLTKRIKIEDLLVNLP